MTARARDEAGDDLVEVTCPRCWSAYGLSLGCPRCGGSGVVMGPPPAPARSLRLVDPPLTAEERAHLRMEARWSEREAAQGQAEVNALNELDGRSGWL
ncbi:MAG: hypothetical protein AAGH15_10985 [Myxococcota bacterium]